MLIAVLKNGKGKQAVVGFVLACLLATFSVSWLVFLFTKGVPYEGWDFVPFYSSARLVLDGRPSDMYDLGVQKEMRTEFLRTIGVQPRVEEALPLLYPGAFVLLFAPLALLPPDVAYFSWFCLSVALLMVGLRQLSTALGLALWPFVVVFAGFLPLTQGLLAGQVHTLIFLGMVGFYVSLRQGNETRAGLWLSLLLIKPQYLLLFVALLIWKRQWAAFRSFYLVGLGILVLSVLLVGLEGLRDYFALLTSSGSAGGIFSNSPGFMVNWRALSLLLFSPDGQVVLASTAALSILGVLFSMNPWRGVELSELPMPRFDVLMLSVVAAAVLTAYHSHAHGLVMMLVPVVAAAASAKTEELGQGLSWILDVLIFGPSLSILFWAAVLVPNASPPVPYNIAVVLMLASVLVYVLLRSSLHWRHEKQLLFETS